MDILQRYQNILVRAGNNLETSSRKLNKQFDLVFKKFEKLRYSVKESLLGIGYKIKEAMKNIDVYADTLSNNIKIWLEMTDSVLDNREKELKNFNPTRQLKLGYSIVSFHDKILKSIKQIKVGEEIDIQISDGKIKSKIKDIIS
jgi:exodeoxyribonuclease VII large subunit